MADGAAFEPARKSGDHIIVAARANEPSAGAQASRPRPAGGLLRPSQVPVPGVKTMSAGFTPLAGEPAHHGLKALRPSGAPTGAAPGPARPSTVPARPVPDVLPGSGQPLATPVKEEMQARLGADFSQVRVHTGSVARALAACVGARAYTVGSHVVIGGGADKHVLAHELTHVIQQRQGPVAGTGHGSGLKVSDPSDRDEKAAEANAVRVMAAPLAGRLAAAAPRQLADGARAAAIPPVQQVAKSSADANRAQGAPVIQRMVDYSGPTIGVEQEIRSGEKVDIPNEQDRGLLGEVKKNGEVLVQFTSDVGSASEGYTIELKTTPTEKNAQSGTGLPQAILDRLVAMEVMVGAIKRAGLRGGSVVSGTYGEYTIKILNPNHSIRLNAAVSDAFAFSNQATMGVKTSDLLLGANPDAKLILESAKWFKPGLGSQLDPTGLQDPQRARAVYALVASAIESLHSIVEESDKARVVDEEIEGDLYHTTVKDKWGVLPRTPVWDWINPLPGEDQKAVKKKLLSTYGRGPEAAAYNHIVNRRDLAGHKVSASTIGGAQASVFEFRSVPHHALGQYLYSSSGGEWKLPEDLLKEEQREAEEVARNKSLLSKHEQEQVEELISGNLKITDEKISGPAAIAAIVAIARKNSSVPEDKEEIGNEWD